MFDRKASHPRAEQLAAFFLLAMGLCWRLPVLQTGFSVDDYAQTSMIEGSYAVPRAPLALFTFSDGSERENTRLRAVGMFPWWSDPQLRVSFMRPLSSALMWVDEWAFERNAYAYHLHSAAWWIAMMWVCWLVLRTWLPSMAAILAFAIIAAHPSHAVLLGWIANRNAIVATAFAMLGIWVQIRTQRDRRPLGYVLAAGCYLLGLLASEYAFAYLGYGAALSWFARDQTVSRTRRIGVWAVAVAAYLLLRAGLGFGTRGSGMYIDPAHEPLASFANMAERLPVLISDLVLAARSNWWSAGFPWAPALAQNGIVPLHWAADLRPFRTVQVCLGLFAILPLSLVIRWVTETSSRNDDRDLRFVAVGALFALLPASASLPESRLMLPALIGWSALLSYALALALRRWSTARDLWRALQVAALAALVLLEAAFPVWVGSDEIVLLPRLARAVRESILSNELDSVVRPGQRLLLLSAVDPTTTIYIPAVRRVHRRPAPDSCQLLIGGYGPLRLNRTSESGFELERLQRELTALDVYASAFNRAPLRPGQRFISGDFEAQVEEAHEGRPTRVRYELHRSLDDPSIVLLAQTAHGLQPISFPTLGQSLLVEPAAMPVSFDKPR